MNYKPLILFIAFTLVLSSCKKILDEQPLSSFAETTAFSNPDRVELAMYGVYDAAQSGFYTGNTIRGYPFGAASLEQGDMRGEDMLNQAQFFAFTYEATYSNSSPNNGFMWQTLYTLINTANLTIEGAKGAVGTGVISAATATQYEAECRFLRAMAHHELVIHFARPYADGNGTKPGIIWRDFGINSGATVQKAREQKRTPVGENYAKILEDLDFAEANLPVTVRDIKNVEIKTYRASKAAAIALKMRIKLHKQDWAGVIAEGAKLVPANAPFVSPIGGWTLTPSPDGPFTNNLSTESIFSIRNDANDNPGSNGALANMLGSPALNGRGLARVSPISYNLPAWRCDDLRRSLLLREDGRSYYVHKYRDYVNWSDAAPHLRYAEVLLTLAEAEARASAGVTARAVTLLNAVRNRAVTNPASQYTVGSFATTNDLIKAILDERRIEFLGEGKRWGDIHRLAMDPVFSTGGIPGKMTFANATFDKYNCVTPPALTLGIAAIPYNDFRFLWPLPIEEVQQQGTNVEQNPGY